MFSLFLPVEPELKLVDETVCFVVSRITYVDLKTREREGFKSEENLNNPASCAVI